jgi:hypothetical protein
VADGRGEVAPVGSGGRRSEVVADHGPCGLEAGAAVQLHELVERAEAAEHAGERGPLGAERRGHGRARLPEPGVLLDSRPDGGHDAAFRRDHPGELAQHRPRVGGDHEREPAHGRVERAVLEREPRSHVGVEESDVGSSLFGALAGGGQPLLAHIDPRDRGPGPGQVDGQPPAAAAHVEHRDGAGGRGEDLGEARRPPAVAHDAETPPMYRAGSASNRARQPEQQK